VSGDWLNRKIRKPREGIFQLAGKPNPNFEHGLKVLCIYLLVDAVLSRLLTVSGLLTCVSSPCRHVTSVLTVLYNTDTCAIHLPTSELSSNSSVYANAPSHTHRHPHSVTNMPSHTWSHMRY